VFGPHATPTVFVHTPPHDVMLVSKQYCGCGKPCSVFPGHWQQFAPTRFSLPHFPVTPLQTWPAGASTASLCRAAHVAWASAGPASKQAPVAWQQRVVQGLG